jgi:hypothetical protein
MMEIRVKEERKIGNLLGVQNNNSVILLLLCSIGLDILQEFISSIEYTMNWLVNV